MKLPRIADIQLEVPRAELRRALEAMLAGLRAERPDGVDDWDELVEEVERLLNEIKTQS